MTVATAETALPLRDELIAHAVGSLENAEHFSLPFPHIFFRDFFPADFYQDLINSYPQDAAYGNIKGKGLRTALRLYGDNIDAIEDSVREKWAAVSAMLASPEIETAIRRRLEDGLEIRRRGDKLASVDDLKLVAKPVLYKDVDGYEIKPHPDARKKVVTMQLYCPPDEKQIEMGTTLYKASVKGLVKPSSYFLEPVKTFPFIPNVGYAFVVLKAYHSLLKMSWHGRPTIHTAIERPRMSILNTFYVSEDVGY
jgi:hypothetical protein